MNCCCERDGVLPEKAAQPTDSFNTTFFAVADHFSMNVGSIAGGEAFLMPAPSGPSLQILLCVWRC